MHKVVWQEDNKIEISLWGEVKDNELKEVFHQIESLAAAHSKINLLLDAGGVDRYDIGMSLEQYDFYKEYKDHLDRVALVSDRPFEQFMTKILDKFSDTEFRAFSNARTGEARRWIFPPRLP
jgi:hypothetical protein